MSTNNTWIETIINSSTEIKAAKMPFNLSEKILEKLSISDFKIIPIQPQIKWAMAAVITLLISLNTIILLQYKKTLKENKSETTSLYSKYFDYTEQF